MDPPPTDATIIERSSTDPEEFGLIFDRHFRAIYAYARRRLEAEAAEDVAASVFLVAFEQRQSFDLSRPSAKPWLFGIAVNLARRHYRDQRRFLAALARTGVDPIADEGADADRRLSAEATVRSLASALAELADDDREAILLYAWDELSYPEIAECTGVALGTVKSRIARARRRLAEAASASANPTASQTRSLT